ncbi:MAG: hypothetical protein HBSAPP03_10830 [Phycisphaerae bacterium]|nr:MAG: hypothetical protein HBSAPP03_10830 [Phycisphaerae bacterium]
MDKSGVDALMERASSALAQGDYFETAGLARRALDQARRDDDFERMARVCLPLQEARRLIREQALDAGRVVPVSALPSGRVRLEPGCYDVHPPAVGITANSLRAMLDRRRVPAMVVAREPATREGRWPVVLVGSGQFMPVVARAKVAPPPDGAATPAWMLAAHEALGDAAIAQVRPEWPADHRVDDLLERLEGLPDHEKLMQALATACREAARLESRSPPRRRTPLDDPYGF